MINGVTLPEADMRGRAFPFNATGPHFVGPALVGGVLYKMKVWQNVSREGRSYLRVLFELPTEEESASNHLD